MQITADSVTIERTDDRYHADAMGFRVYFLGMRDLRQTVACEVDAGHLPWAVGASILSAAKQRLDAEPTFAPVEVDRRWVNWPVAVIAFTTCVYVVAVLRVAAWSTEWLFHNFN